MGIQKQSMIVALLDCSSVQYCNYLVYFVIVALFSGLPFWGVPIQPVPLWVSYSHFGSLGTTQQLLHIHIRLHCKITRLRAEES